MSSGTNFHNIFALSIWILVLSGVLYPRILPSNARTSEAMVQAVQHPYVSSPVQPSDLYTIYQSVQNDYIDKALHSNWKILNQKDGVEVALLEHESGTTPYVRMKAILPVPVQDTWDFLRVANWDRTMPKMDPFYEGVSLLGEHRHRRHDFKICRKRMKRILMFDPRDLVFVSVTQDDPLHDGTLVSGTVSIQTPLAPRSKGYVRAFQDSIATYKPLDDGKSTELTIVCRIDLNDHANDHNDGFIPMWFYVKTIGVTGAQSVIRMRNALVEDARNKKQPAKFDKLKQRFQKLGWKKVQQA